MIVAGYYDGKDYGPPSEWLKEQEYARYGGNAAVECDADAEVPDEDEEKEAAWNLWKTCGGRGLVAKFTADELNESEKDSDDTPWEEGEN